jgi:hypothetical protein
MVQVLVDRFNEQDEIVEASSFDPQPLKDAEGVDTGMLIWYSKKVPKGDADVDIGCGNSFGGGGEEETDDSVEMVNNCIDLDLGFGYNAMPFGSKSELKDWFKAYMTKLRKKLKTDGASEEEMAAFKAQAAITGKWVLSNYKELDAYAPKSFETENCLIFAYWDDKANASGSEAFVAIAAGLKNVKY